MRLSHIFDIIRLSRKLYFFSRLSCEFSLFLCSQLNHSLKNALLKANILHSHLVHHLDVLVEKSVNMFLQVSRCRRLISLDTAKVSTLISHWPSFAWMQSDGHICHLNWLQWGILFIILKLRGYRHLWHVARSQRGAIVTDHRFGLIALVTTIHVTWHDQLLLCGSFFRVRYHSWIFLDSLDLIRGFSSFTCLL